MRRQSDKDVFWAVFKHLDDVPLDGSITHSDFLESFPDAAIDMEVVHGIGLGLAASGLMWWGEADE